MGPLLLEELVLIGRELVVVELDAPGEDVDLDGYGAGCALGSDCDDDDKEVWRRLALHFDEA